jgi:DNA (cytosine-5)-methyltransferase 1
MIENVRQILTQKDGYARKTICSMLDELGYNVNYKVLNASDFGVPQNRRRAFFVGIRKDIGEFSFEIIEKYIVKIKTTVDEALGDLYKIEDKNNCNDKHKYDVNFNSEYLKIMHDGSGCVENHFIKYPNMNVQKRIHYVPTGGNWKDVPEELFPSKRDNRHSNYMRRLDRNGQSITIDTGHDVYFHPIFDRVPTVRESARIQSFPDKFKFLGTRCEQLRQVGNAVPPLLANVVAKGIIEVLDNEK